MVDTGVLHEGEALAAPSPVASQAPSWLANYASVLTIVDAIAITVAALIAQRYRFGDNVATLESVSYSVISGLMAPAWVLVMFFGRTYEGRFLGAGSDEYSRVFNAAIRFSALIAIGAYAFNLPVSRGYVGIALPLGTLLTILGRYAGRQLVHRGRRRGRFMHRTVVVGERGPAALLVRQLCAEATSGFDVVAACLPGGGETLNVEGQIVPVMGALTQVADVVRSVRADTVAIASSRAISATVLRRLSWELEGSGIDVVVAPSLVDVAGPRIHVRPVAGLPLLHVEEPEFSGTRRTVKRAFDIVSSLLLLVLLAPWLLLIWLAVRLTSAGPGFYVQTRIGRDGEPFRMLKFRSMRVAADSEVDQLAAHNEQDGLLFKIRDDPRVTRVGRVLRRYSIDELPQLWNVLRGTMSLVGPRPPLPGEVERYESAVKRRLLVPPGVTGLWQVSGRSDLSWDESVRLDLYYVENWSVTMDLAILGKTLVAVLRRRGAY